MFDAHEDDGQGLGRSRSVLAPHIDLCRATQRACPHVEHRCQILNFERSLYSVCKRKTIEEIVTPFEPSEELIWAQLAAELEARVAEFPGVAGVCVRDLPSGRQFGLRDEELFPT